MVCESGSRKSTTGADQHEMRVTLLLNLKLQGSALRECMDATGSIACVKINRDWNKHTQSSLGKLYQDSVIFLTRRGRWDEIKLTSAITIYLPPDSSKRKELEAHARGQAAAGPATKKAPEPRSCTPPALEQDWTTEECRETRKARIRCSGA